MSFKEDLKTGRQYEYEVAKLFNKLYQDRDRKFIVITKEEYPQYYKLFDIAQEPYLWTPNLIPHDAITIECKWSSDKHSDSPNVIIETSSYRDETSGICTSEAKFWVWRVGDDHLVVKRDELMRAILYDLKQDSIYRKIKFKKLDHKELMIMPIELLVNERLCPSTKKYPIE